MFFTKTLVTVVFATLAAAGPVLRRQTFALQNGVDAQKQNNEFLSLTADASCQNNDVACINGAFASCVNGKYVLSPCNTGLTCVALPSTDAPGTR